MTFSVQNFNLLHFAHVFIIWLEIELRHFEFGLSLRFVRNYLNWFRIYIFNFFKRLICTKWFNFPSYHLWNKCWLMISVLKVDNWSTIASDYMSAVTNETPLWPTCLIWNNSINFNCWVSAKVVILVCSKLSTYLIWEVFPW